MLDNNRRTPFLTRLINKLSPSLWIIGLLGFMVTACQAAPPPAPEEIHMLFGVTADTSADVSAEVSGQLFEGFYAAAPEVSSFVPCAMGELPGPGKGYWLIPNEEFSQWVEHPAGITIGDIGTTYGPYDQFAVYLRFEGILSGEPGKGYGHSGLYAGEVQVTRALEVSRQWVGKTRLEEVFVGCGR